MALSQSQGEGLPDKKGSATMILKMPDFAELTAAILQDVGLEYFVPVLIDPEQMTIRALDNIPHGVDHNVAALEWVAALGLDTYGLAYRRDDEIRLVVCREGALEERALDVPSLGRGG